MHPTNNFLSLKGGMMEMREAMDAISSGPTMYPILTTGVLVQAFHRISSIQV